MALSTLQKIKYVELLRGNWRLFTAYLVSILISVRLVLAENVEANVTLLRLFLNTNLLLVPYFVGLILIIICLLVFFEYCSQYDRELYWASVFAVAIIGTSLIIVGGMPNLDPQNDHDEAIEAGADAVLDGEYPYYASSNTDFIVANFTSLPFTFLTAIPFYLFLDVGFMALVGYLLIALSIYKVASTVRRALLSLWVIHISLPLFDSFIIQSNHLFILGVFSILIWSYQKHDPRMSGLAGGCLIATKGMVWPALCISGYCSIRTWETKKWIKFGMVTVCSSLILILPFFLYDPSHFMNVAPLGVQANHFPQIFGSYSTLVFVLMSLSIGIVSFEILSNELVGMFTTSLFLYLVLPNKFQLIVVLLAAFVILEKEDRVTT